MQVLFLGTEFDVESGESWNVIGLGSGFIVSEDGYVLTAEHVIGKGKIGIVDSVGRKLELREIRVITHDGKDLEARLPEPYPPNLGIDIGMLKIDKAVDLPYISLADVDSLELGEGVVVLGYPEAELTVTQGIINIFSPNRQTFRMSAAISAKSSGSPVLNSDGKAIGIATYSVRKLRPDSTAEAFFGTAANLVTHRKHILDFIQQRRSEYKNNPTSGKK